MIERKTVIYEYKWILLYSLTKSGTNRIREYRMSTREWILSKLGTGEIVSGSDALLHSFHLVFFADTSESLRVEMRLVCDATQWEETKISAIPQDFIK